jgi:hypothetical protein
MVLVGINPECALGVSIPLLRQTAKQLGRDHGRRRVPA